MAIAEVSNTSDLADRLAGVWIVLVVNSIKTQKLYIYIYHKHRMHACLLVRCERAEYIVAVNFSVHLHNFCKSFKYSAFTVCK